MIVCCRIEYAKNLLALTCKSETIRANIFTLTESQNMDNVLAQAKPIALPLQKLGL
jgi:hypothetical protein